MAEGPDSIRLQNLARAYRHAGILKAGIQLDLFTVISKGTREISQIADQVGISVQNARKMVDICCALDLLTFKDGEYFNAPDVERYLVKGEKRYLGVWLGTEQESLFSAWADVAPILTGEKPPVSTGYYDEAWTDVEAAHLFNQATYNVGLGGGRKLARVWDFSNHSLMVDLGGGSGAYSIAIAEAYPHMKAVVNDYPTMCASAERFIAEAGFSDRVTTLPGDVVEVDYPTDADVMLLSSNMPNFSNDAFRTILKKACKALAPGGTMIILAEAIYDDHSGPLQASLWYMDETILGGPGETRTMSETCDWMKEAGFEDIQVSEFARDILTLITAKKPA